jgi:hypothetical protein
VVDVAPGLHEYVLDDLLEVALVVEQAADDAGDANLVEPDELDEGVLVSRAGAFEQAAPDVRLLRGLLAHR